MVTIQIKQKMTPSVFSFVKREWTTADLKYRGEVINWKNNKRVLSIYENKELIGVLELSYVAGVMHIEEIIVAFSHHKKGIGTMLMKQAEEIAKKEKLHKIYLETGKPWGVSAFYEKLGYVKTGELPKHNCGQDYIQYSKFL
jgi:histone acetyltransferase (RNA polymerase elongator complex component)